MAVPSGGSDKRNTTGGVFIATTEGGTILRLNGMKVHFREFWLMASMPTKRS